MDTCSPAAAGLHIRTGFPEHTRDSQNAAQAHDPGKQGGGKPAQHGACAARRVPDAVGLPAGSARDRVLRMRMRRGSGGVGKGSVGKEAVREECPAPGWGQSTLVRARCQAQKGYTVAEELLLYPDLTPVHKRAKLQRRFLRSGPSLTLRVRNPVSEPVFGNRQWLPSASVRGTLWSKFFRG